MKNLLMSFLLLWSIKSLAIAVPQSCDRLLKGSNYLLEGYVDTISEEIDCQNPSCSSYYINYSARFIVDKSINGDIYSGSVIYVKYKDVVHSPEDGFFTDFQGHDPKPKVSEYWRVFVDRNGDDTFAVVPPNGWWPSENVECWLDTSARPILERIEEGCYVSNDVSTCSRTITVYSDGKVYATEKYDSAREESTLIATLTSAAVSDIADIIYIMEPGAIDFIGDATCSNSEFVNYRALQWDFRFQSILFAQANDCQQGFIEYDEQDELIDLKELLDGFSTFFED